MSVLIYDEIRRFGIVLLTGILLAGSYDILRIIRAVFIHAKWLEDGEDILFWIIWFVYLVDELYYGSYGTIRGFVVLAFLAGVGIYEKACSYWIVMHCATILLKWKQRMCRIFCKIFRFLLKLTRNGKDNTIKIGSKFCKRGYRHENKKKSCVSQEKAAK